MKYVKTKKYFKGKILRQTCSTGYFILKTKAVAQSCSVKKVFLEISQNSQENTCARVCYLIKLQA